MNKLYELKLEASNRISAADSKKFEPKNLKKWLTKTTKGGLYFNEQLNGIFSNSFVLDLKSKSTVYFSIQTSTTPLHSSNTNTNEQKKLNIVQGISNN